MKEWVYDDITIKMGQNARENDRLVKESLQTSIWLHLDNFPSAHVVIQNDNPSKAVIKYAAQQLKDYSKYNFNVKVNYISIRYVKRTDKAGLVQLTKSPKSIVL